MLLKKYQIIFIAGGFMFVFSIVYRTAIFPSILRSHLRENVALRVGSSMRNAWTNAEFTREKHIYMFNVTNAEAISKGARPIVKDIGPFVFDMIPTKMQVEDREEDDTVSYTEKNKYYYNKEKSNGRNYDTVLILPNMVMLGPVNILFKERGALMSLLARGFVTLQNNPTSLFGEYTVSSVLFDGLIVDCRNITDFAGQAICREIEENWYRFRMAKLADKLYSLSFYRSMNETDDPTERKIRLNRGIKNIENIGKVVELDDKRFIGAWNDTPCGKLGASDGNAFHPLIKKNGKDILYRMHTFICRSVPLHYDSTVTYAGLKLLRFRGSLGADPIRNPHDQCYCFKPNECFKKGILDLFKCIHIAIVVSNPHFQSADPYFVNSLVGMEPNKEKHLTTVYVDPLTGYPVRTESKDQYNLWIKSVENFKLMKNFPEALLPLMWTNEITIAPDSIIKVIKRAHKLVTIHKVIQYLLMFGGLGMCGFAGYLYYTELQKEKIVKEVSVESRDGSPVDEIETQKKLNMETISSRIELPPIE